MCVHTIRRDVIRFIIEIINELPMKKISTLINDIENKTNSIHVEKKCMPSRKTLDFLTQFARVYHVETSLRADLGRFVMN